MITSSSNPQIKLIRKLKERKYRNETGLFFLEGTRIVVEAIRTPDCLQQLIVARELLSSAKAKEAVDMADKNHIPVMDVSSEVFHSLSGKDGPQGLAAVGQQKWFSAENLGSSINGIWIALYQVADPGNLGTILRTLDGMGGVGVFLLDYCTDPYDPSSIRASMGTIFSKKIIRIQSDDFINWVKKNSIMLIGTSDSAAGNYRDCHYPENMVLLMGSEREGLTTNLENACASIVSIPMTGSADSLNLAVASSIILYEIARQHPLSGREGSK